MYLSTVIFVRVTQITKIDFFENWFCITIHVFP
ncbi:hypothetical protein FWK35_00035724 [Aphis craccivora]|uniref:Uncharacterized protein n=1 Tax=Aphis craccivora TaxID=307492 RepID=A0A6G0VZI7_APHCR|nr:hypothetical protein FWK35_00035724 [Aphis craccivora]